MNQNFKGIPMKNAYRGFSLIELMIVISIIAFLSALSIPSLLTFLAKAKRTEAYVNLRSLALLQKNYWVEHGTYATTIQGAGSLNWKPEGSCNYTYGFPGSYVTGKLGAPGSALKAATVTNNSFTLAAAADIDGDGSYDVITIDHNGNVTLLEDDLAD